MMRTTMANPPTEQFPEGTVTIRLHRRKPQHIIMDRRDVDLVLAEELEMQRIENKHLRRKLGEQARYIVRLEEVAGRHVAILPAREPEDGEG
jgi:hypothetical protein